MTYTSNIRDPILVGIWSYVCEARKLSLLISSVFAGVCVETVRTQLTSLQLAHRCMLVGWAAMLASRLSDNILGKGDTFIKSRFIG